MGITNSATALTDCASFDNAPTNSIFHFMTHYLHYSPFYFRHPCPAHLASNQKVAAEMHAEVNLFEGCTTSEQGSAARGQIGNALILLYHPFEHALKLPNMPGFVKDNY